MITGFLVAPQYQRRAAHDALMQGNALIAVADDVIELPVALQCNEALAEFPVELAYRRPTSADI